MKAYHIAAAAASVLALAAFVAVAAAVERLVAPVRQPLGAPPTALAASPVVLRSPSGDVVHGWFARGAPGQGAVLLLHGLRSDRRQMLGRAGFLHADGRSVLLIDLPAHGRSDGARITFGHREAEGVRAAMRFLRDELPAEHHAVVGVSLGAAAFVLAGVEPPPHAVVLESMYATIADAASSRLRLRAGAAGAKLAPLLVGALSARLGVDAADLRPIDRMATLRAPLLIAAGDADRHTRADETRALFAAAAEPKALWLVEGAGHVDLHAFDPAAYEAVVGAFVARHLAR